MKTVLVVTYNYRNYQMTKKCIFIFSQIISYEIILKQLFTSGSVIIVNKNLDFDSVFIQR